LFQPFDNYRCRYDYCDKSASTIPAYIHESTVECHIQASMVSTKNLKVSLIFC